MQTTCGILQGKLDSNVQCTPLVDQVIRLWWHGDDEFATVQIRIDLLRRFQVVLAELG